ncbi:hypothetical protein G9A89_012697 [Geosiphon pyriformis]|nr:hypothetical protein G9A89_012697 [Geosiphon pyriformis]
MQQQPLQLPSQQPNLDPMAYVPITKLDNFIGKKDDAQIWFNDNDNRTLQAISYFLKDTANLWYQSLAAKPQTFNEFKTEFLRYFSNNNNINYLTNTFTTIKQGDTEAVTTYLECYYNVMAGNPLISDSKSLPKSRPISNYLPANDAVTNLSTSNLLTAVTEDATTNNSESNPPQTTLTNNIPPAIVTKNKSLAAIFLFKLEETINPLLFSRAALEEKPITMMYTDVKVDGYSIKLILDSGSAGSIITKQLIDQLGCQIDYAASAKIITANGTTKTLIGEIDDFPIEVNGIIVPIKILIIETT